MTINLYKRMHAHGFSGSNESNLHPAYEGGELLALLIRTGADMTYIYLQMQDKDGKPLVPLPPVEVTMIPVALTSKARVRR